MTIRDCINKGRIFAGQEFHTPGQGIHAKKQSPFTLAEVNELQIKIIFPNSIITIRPDHIDRAVGDVREAGGQVRIGAFNGWAKSGTLQRFLQDARGSALQDASYVAPMLVECGIAEYTMLGRAKGVRLV